MPQGTEFLLRRIGKCRTATSGRSGRIHLPGRGQLCFEFIDTLLELLEDRNHFPLRMNCQSICPT